MRILQRKEVEKLKILLQQKLWQHQATTKQSLSLIAYPVMHLIDFQSKIPMTKEKQGRPIRSNANLTKRHLVELDLEIEAIKEVGVEGVVIMAINHEKTALVQERVHPIIAGVGATDNQIKPITGMYSLCYCSHCFTIDNSNS